VALTRREFLQHGGRLAGALWLPNFLQARSLQPSPLLNAASLAKFVDPLPIPEIARPAGVRPSPTDPKVKLPFYRMPMRQIEAKVHRDVPPTRLWGFGRSSPGPTFQVRKDEPVLVEWANELPRTHLLSIDHDIHGAGIHQPDVRAVIHVHGGKTPPHSDGYPEAWYVPGKSALYHYPNQQDSAMLWYHDHTLGINRLNVFAGLVGAFFVRDAVEDALPLPRGKYEVPLLICDRAFTRDGQLTYPAKWVNEFSGDAVLVNGKIFPYLDVEPRRYRLRVLNAANSRIFDFSLSNIQKFHQIGSDQGLLPAPVELEDILLAPGERADLIVDFAGHAGEKVLLLDDDAVILQFRVGRAQNGAKDSGPLPSTLRPVPRMAESLAVRSRTLTLSDVILNSDVPVAMLLNQSRWSAPVTETPALDSVEIWELANVTDETHPIHLHLVRFQVLDRRGFDVLAFQEKGVLNYSGPPVPPDPGETGWKDTVQARHGMVTRIIARFEGFAGRYVWHCHVLEHEDNEMMRPFDVVPSPAAASPSGAKAQT
jgi:spore coat protein A, manganese oxidase